MSIPGLTSSVPSRPFGVGELNRAARGLLEQQFADVWVLGEVSRPTRAASGHVYLTLKDPDGRIDAVIWSRQARQLRFELVEGQELLVRGRLTVYPPQGRFQLVCEELRLSGEGALRAAMMRLKQRLESEGLLDPARKRPIPLLPRGVGLVTSGTGAAVDDVLRTVFRRFPGMRVVLCPVRVQGEGSAEEISEGLRRIAAVSGLDVLVVGRGGGSLEDLWAFNEEIVARAIVASPLPVVSAVGHEMDVTIADLVADLRAATPTAAGELVVPERSVLEATLVDQGTRLAEAARRRLGEVRVSLAAAHQRAGQRVLPRLIADRRQDLDFLQQRATRGLLERLRLADMTLERAATLMRAHAPGRWVREQRPALESARRRLSAAARSSLEAAMAANRALAGRLQALDPLAVLARGFSVTRVVRDGRPAILRDSAAARDGEQLFTTVASGPELVARVEGRRALSEPGGPSSRSPSGPRDP